MFTQEELASKTLPELQQIAKSMGAHKVRSYRKEELIEYILDEGNLNSNEPDDESFDETGLNDESAKHVLDTISDEAEAVKAKRPVGRPRRANIAESDESLFESSLERMDSSENDKIKRPVGRPKRARIGQELIASSSISELSKTDSEEKGEEKVILSTSNPTFDKQIMKPAFSKIEDLPEYLGDMQEKTQPQENIEMPAPVTVLVPAAPALVDEEDTEKDETISDENSVLKKEERTEFEGIIQVSGVLEVIA
jgi:hypothetical protein